MSKFAPFLSWRQRITPEHLRFDLLAGLTGAILVLPQGVAYALIAGFPPEYGLYGAMIFPIIAGLFGSSWHLISGPAAAISIVILSVVGSQVPPESADFIPMALTLTLLVGLIQLGLGLAKMGALVNFISHTVIVGFTGGAALLIVTSQIKYALGITLTSGSSFFSAWQQIIKQLGEANLYTLVVAVITILVTLAIQKYQRKLPAMLIGMIAGSLAAYVLRGEQNGIAMVGAMPGTLPSFSMPDLRFDTVSTLLPGAVALAILGLVEAASIARAIAHRSGQRIEGNQEFIGQGLANTLGSFLSCFAGSGSFTRSGANFDAGAKTPLAGVFAALLVGVVMVIAPNVTDYLPLSAMAGSIVLIAWRLIDIHHIKEIIHASRAETIVLVVTGASTLLVQLEFAIYFGVLVSMLQYLKRTSKPSLIEIAPHSLEHGTDQRNVERFNLPVCPQIRSVRIDGSLYFGAINHVQQSLESYRALIPRPKHLLLDCSGVNFIDLSAAEMLVKEIRHFNDCAIHVSFYGLKNTVKEQFIELGYADKLESNRFFLTTDSAINSVLTQIDPKICQGCSARVYQACK